MIDGRPADVYQAIRPGKQKGKTVTVTRRARIRVRRAGAGLALLSAAAAACLRFLRRWHMNWGATDTEASGEVAGDELLPDAGIVSTRVVDIAAPPSAIWPWLRHGPLLP